MQHEARLVVDAHLAARRHDAQGAVHHRALLGDARAAHVLDARTSAASSATGSPRRPPPCPPPASSGILLTRSPAHS